MRRPVRADLCPNERQKARVVQLIYRRVDEERTTFHGVVKCLQEMGIRYLAPQPERSEGRRDTYCARKANSWCIARQIEDLLFRGGRKQT